MGRYRLSRFRRDGFQRGDQPRIRTGNRRWRRYGEPTLAIGLVLLAIFLYWFLLARNEGFTSPVEGAASVPLLPVSANDSSIPTPVPESPPAQAPQGMAVQAARDSSPSTTVVHAWRLFALLKSGSGRLYSIHVSVLPQAAEEQGLRCDASLNEYRRRTRFQQSVLMPGAHMATPEISQDARLSFDAPGCRVDLKGRQLNVAIDSEGFSVALAGPIPDRVWQPKGTSVEGTSRLDLYPDVALKGQLGITGAGSVPVAGQAWLAHEVDETTRPGADHLRLVLRSEDPEALLLERNGAAFTLWRSGHAAPTHNVALTPQSRWQNPVTKVHYTTAWRLELPEGVVDIQAMRPDSVLLIPGDKGEAYWAGAVRFTGAVSGTGFALQ